jgi:hypothetical protein
LFGADRGSLFDVEAEEPEFVDGFVEDEGIRQESIIAHEERWWSKKQMYAPTRPTYVNSSTYA